MSQRVSATADDGNGAKVQLYVGSWQLAEFFERSLYSSLVLRKRFSFLSELVSAAALLLDLLVYFVHKNMRKLCHLICNRCQGINFAH